MSKMYVWKLLNKDARIIPGDDRILPIEAILHLVRWESDMREEHWRIHMTQGVSMYNFSDHELREMGETLIRIVRGEIPGEEWK